MARSTKCFNCKNFYSLLSEVPCSDGKIHRVCSGCYHRYFVNDAIQLTIPASTNTVKCFVCGNSGEYGLVPCSDGKKHRVCETCTKHCEVLGTVDLESEQAYLLKENKRRFTFEAIDTTTHTVVYEFDLCLTLDDNTDTSIEDTVTHLIEKAHGDRYGVVRPKDELKNLRIVVSRSLGDIVEDCVRDFSLLNVVAHNEELARQEAAKYFETVKNKYRVSNDYLLRASKQHLAQYSYTGSKYFRPFFHAEFKAEYNRLYDAKHQTPAKQDVATVILPTPDQDKITEQEAVTVILPTPDDDTCFGPIEEDKITEQEAVTPVQTPFNQWLEQARSIKQTCDFCGTEHNKLELDLVQTNRNTVGKFCNNCMIAHMQRGIFVYPDQNIDLAAIMAQAEKDAQAFYSKHNDASLREMNEEISACLQGVWLSLTGLESYETAFKTAYHRLFVKDNPVKIDLRTQAETPEFTPVSLPDDIDEVLVKPVRFKRAESSSIAAKIRKNALKYASRGITLLIIAIMACSVIGLIHSSDTHASTMGVCRAYMHHAGWYVLGYPETTYGYHNVTSATAIYGGDVPPSSLHCPANPYNQSVATPSTSSTPASTTTPAKHHTHSKKHHRAKKHTPAKHATTSTSASSNSASSYVCIIVKK